MSSDKPLTHSDEEVAYHTVRAEQLREAQEVQAKIARTQAGWEHWAEYLKGKYGFTDGDVITEEGKIVYGPSSSNGSASHDGHP
jgi:hypothetical protein